MVSLHLICIFPWFPCRHLSFAPQNIFQTFCLVQDECGGIMLLMESVFSYYTYKHSSCKEKQVYQPNESLESNFTKWRNKYAETKTNRIRKQMERKWKTMEAQITAITLAIEFTHLRYPKQNSHWNINLFSYLDSVNEFCDNFPCCELKADSKSSGWTGS